MDDTSNKIKKLIQTKYAALSGEARFIMGAEMFNSARKLVLASLPKGLSDTNIRKELFLRFYRNDFPKDQLQKITNWITHTKNGC